MKNQRLVFKRGARRQSEPSRTVSKEKKRSEDPDIKPGAQPEAENFNFLHD